MSLSHDQTSNPTPNTNSNTNLTQFSSQNSHSGLTYILQHIFDKVRTLCKECQLSNLPAKISVTQFIHANNINLTNNVISQINQYIQALDELRTKIFEYNELQQQYKKLEAALQKNETEIRKHIAIQQQFKLYVDTMKGQYEDSENERIELLQNSKMMIKQLKMENEKLFDKLSEYEGNLSKQKQKYCFENKDKQKKQLRARQTSKKTINHSKNKQRIKSQYCSSLHVYHNRNNTEITSITPLKERQKFKLLDYRNDLTERPQNSKKKKLGDIKKKQNYTVMAYVGHHHRKRQSKDKNQFKSTLITFSDKKKTNFNQFKEKQKSDKKVNRSVLSLESIDQGQE